jgi:hypothetical protein
MIRCRNVRPWCLVIAVLQLFLVAGVLLGGGKLPLMLDLYGARDEFVVLMSASSIAILIGYALPNRKVRHAGLWMTAFSLFPAYGLLLDNGMAGWSALTMPMLAVLSLALLFIDSLGKPRHVQKVDR